MKPKSSQSSGKCNETVGYGKPPKSFQFKPGQSGNPKGKAKGQPSLSEIVLSEIGRLVKVKLGEEVVHLTKKQALVRKLIDMGLQGNLGAAQLVLNFLPKAEAVLEKSEPVELPLTDDELAILKEMTSGGGVGFP